MEKIKVIKKVRELAQASHMPYDKTAINQSEIAVIMKTFGISWNDVKQLPDTFSLYYEIKRTESDLRQELEGMLKTLNLAKNKGLRSQERDMKLMVKGFLKGVSFFNQKLSNEFSIMADKSYASA